MAGKMNAFRKSREEKGDQQDKTKENDASDNRESPVASPMLGGTRSKTAGGIKKTERMTMRLPVSGVDVELTSAEVIPSECRIHPRNQRVQSLLRLENPKVASLRENIKRDKQREPVISRWLDIDGKKVLEVLDGSRRRFVCDDLHRENPEILLRAWVGKIPDADAEYIAKFGNDDRDDVSPWEEAMSLKQIERENPSWSHEVIAANEKKSRQTVTNLLQIADIPIEIVLMLESPDLLKVNSGLQVAKLVREAKGKNYLSELEKSAPFKKFSDLSNRLKELVKPKPSLNTPSANRKIEIKKGKSVRASIGVNRSKPGQYKVDLFSLSDSEYQEVLEALEKILK